MLYLDKINHPLLQKANAQVCEALKKLKDMGLEDKEARNWIEAWVSDAGAGSE